ncbi:GCN5-related N-acetyltransferase 5, chloroplastic [Lycium barbarum]|uniref:GCN5-related N-acetyltransferase 5, chloroplastic n=1 Tax=Lycium barbarum TaxID=112863 RepID=UPI00293ECA4A|nr:GCN5-related N-acetyltransferase 5, chloroplastic [Lycium barbarum]
MATAISLSFSLDPQSYHHHFHHNNMNFNSHKVSIFTPKYTFPFLISSKSHTSNLIIPLSTSQSSSQTPLQTGRFLTNQELEKLQSLEKYRYFQELESGSLWIRLMKEEEMDVTVWLLAESFAESMLMPKGYVKFLAYLVKQYMIERRTMMPHAATLLGFYKENGEDVDLQLAGTVEVCFDKRGANANPPTPTPPKNSPYICNMTVDKLLRRRGIGWHLLKASEELISQMSSSREVYLHCRMIDTAPLNMYKKAGYTIVETDNIFILLTLQRRKHLMCKVLPDSEIPFDVDECTSSVDTHVNIDNF